MNHGLIIIAIVKTTSYRNYFLINSRGLGEINYCFQNILSSTTRISQIIVSQHLIIWMKDAVRMIMATIGSNRFKI
jgi:hypothetical protein